MYLKKYCSICGTISTKLERVTRLFPEPHISFDCKSCSILSDSNAIIVQSRPLQFCINCQTPTKKLSVDKEPICSVECLVQKELGK